MSLFRHFATLNYGVSEFWETSEPSVSHQDNISVSSSTVQQRFLPYQSSLSIANFSRTSISLFCSKKPSLHSCWSSVFIQCIHSFSIRDPATPESISRLSMRFLLKISSILSLTSMARTQLNEKPVSSTSTPTPCIHKVFTFGYELLSLQS